MAAASSGLPVETLKYLFHHVFLPPKLPQSDDYQDQFDSRLIQAAIDGLNAYRSTVQNENDQHVISALDMLTSMQKVHSGGAISEVTLQRSLDELANKGETAILLHIRAQNAGVLVSKTSEGTRFDLWELSPLNDAVYACKGRLHRSFPGATVLTNSKCSLQESDFREAVAHSLASMGSHTVVGMRPKAKKAASLQDEDRDTIHPGMVTEVFAGFLSSLGLPEAAPAISKSTREEVLWDDARSPWHRSATWMLIRVALQLTLVRATGSNRLYKECMLFIHSIILSYAVQQEASVPNEMLYTMTAKVSRRLLKLDDQIDQKAADHVHKIVRSASDVISKGWSDTQKRSSHRLQLHKLRQLNLSKDSYLGLPLLDEYIIEIARRQSSDGAVSDFVPSSSPKTFPAHTLPTISFSGFNQGDYILANLHRFEEWVASNALAWAGAHGDSKNTPGSLASLMIDYHGVAQIQYADNPEGISTMILTIFQLWIACDTAALHLCPLLAEYHPGVRIDELQNLLLPQQKQMKRLQAVEKYVTDRCIRAKYPSSELYERVSSRDCFAARYFDESSAHKELLRQITKRAEEERQAKKTELSNLKAQHDRLMEQYNSSLCDMELVVSSFTGLKEEQHKSSCQRCSFKNLAASLTIYLHEWPLPECAMTAKTVIFELHVPVEVSTWRDGTFYLLRDVLRAEYIQHRNPRSEYVLRADPHLGHQSQIPGDQTIGLLSETKPQVVTHRKAKKVSITIVADVCVRNGLQYHYFDSKARNFVSALKFNQKVPESCTLKLPEESAALQRYIFRPAASFAGPGPNSVIAHQSDCPAHMTLEEFTSLCAIPLGNHIQWHNVLVQLAAPSIDFKKDETAILLLQCIYQAGPPDGTSIRASHTVVTKDDFAERLLEMLETALQKTKENWESSQALSIFCALAARLLSLSPSNAIQNRCLAFLETARTVAIRWVELLRTKAQNARNSEDRTEFLAKSVDVALICALSLNVDDEYLTAVLSQPEDGSTFIQCSIIIQEGKPEYSAMSEPVQVLQLSRFRRLLPRAFASLAKNHAALDDAVSKSWPSFRRGHGWAVISEELCQWVTTQATTKDGEVGLPVHYNILTGELLVNGLPLGRPPSKYEKQELWPVLFGNAPVEVMPTLTPGMEFSAKQLYHGCEVHLALKDTGSCTDLIIQASINSEFYEMIPPRFFRNHFPEHLVDNYVPWLNGTSKKIEFRPKDDAWNRFSSRTWLLSGENLLSGCQLLQNGVAVFGTNNDTATEIGRILRPLADSTRIHIFLQPNHESVEVEIPTLQLGFSLQSRDSHLYSRESKGMYVDEDQSLGTLVGFSNKLLLRVDDPPRRSVLVPEGQVSCYALNGHVKVSVDKSSIVKVHPLQIDELLGRLVDNGSLQGKLYLSYLHALTAFCLPDPLTGKTGTEQALTILTSAAVRSFEQLSELNIETLLAIARLTPRRQYYPEHERSMQTVSWNSSLGFLSQHNKFLATVKSLFDQALQSSIFYPESELPRLELPENDFGLIERDSIRSATFRVSEFGAEDQTHSQDMRYNARDVNQCSPRGAKAHRLSTTIFAAENTLHYEPVSDLWTTLATGATDGTIHGPNSEYFKRSSLKYTANSVLCGFNVSLLPAVHKTLRDTNADPVNKYHFMMWLSGLAAEDKANMSMLQTLALIYTASGVRHVTSPMIETCHVQMGYQSSRLTLKGIIQANKASLKDSPEGKLPKLQNEGARDFANRRSKLFNKHQEDAVDAIARVLDEQWRADTVTVPNLSSSIQASHLRYIHVDEVLAATKTRFKLWYDNRKLYEYLQRVHQNVALLRHSSIPLPLWPTAVVAEKMVNSAFVTSRNLFYAAVSGTDNRFFADIPSLSTRKNEKQTFRLSSLVDRLMLSSSSAIYERRYVVELKQSLGALEAHSRAGKLQLSLNMKHNLSIFDKQLQRYRSNCSEFVDALYRSLIDAVTASAQSQPQLSKSSTSRVVRQWPRVSPMFFLQQLHRDRWKLLSDGWRKRVVQYGIALTELHRADRLLEALRSRSEEDLITEIKNAGHENWDPLEHPETLLLEVESGILVREVQEQIASEMRAPQSGRNTVMQLNMGEGKSSVIVPMVAAALADSNQLVRVVVAKPQSKQMAQMLISKLGGLLDRRVFYLPFSRALKMDKPSADTVQTMLRQCMTGGGVLLVQPEHILSFQLMGLECYNTLHQGVGHSLLRTQDFLDTNARDILDESDENLSVKFELIYTMGAQRLIEHAPSRWICISQVLDLVKEVSAGLVLDMPTAIEYSDHHQGGFPRIRILEERAGEKLVSRVATKISEAGLDGFPIQRQVRPVRSAVLTYLTVCDIDDNQIKEVEESEFFSDNTKATLFLLRGLLAGGVLVFTLGQKRWRVNYGLVSTRVPPTRLAVPYRAKDVPAPRAEFSHPDVVIALTCISYYYGGLNDDDLFTAFGRLMTSDQADIDYQQWMKDASDMPPAFRQLEGINLKDRPQCIGEVFPHLKYSKSVLDYFLANIVFPKEMREFPHKLSASGWDLAAAKGRPSTGFSGTNDAKVLLPLDIAHLDLDKQQHTNALVMEYLLDPANSVKTLSTGSDHSISDAERLLRTVVELQPPVRVILDPGAQILELTNQQVAQTWLEMHSDDQTKAVVFVNDADDISVVDRAGHTELLQVSPFAGQLDMCLVFLDEAHTRGIDLKLPSHYRAAVTLGANLTKDALVQACMRMRKLGKGQNVIFCVSQEIENKIRVRTSKHNDTSLELPDVLDWAIEETFRATRRAVPLWAVQGERFLRQQELWNASSGDRAANMSPSHATKFLEVEAQALKDRYRPRISSDKGASASGSSSPGRLREIEDRCNEFDNLQSGADLQEEQERELAPENERERQVQRPPPAQPKTHSLHRDVSDFVSEGKIKVSSDGYQNAFQSLHDTSAAKGFNLSQLTGRPELLVSTDFANAVQKTGGKSYLSDSYQRPVQWILTLQSEVTSLVTHMMIISPYEAHHLIHQLSAGRGADNVVLHLYKPRCNASHRVMDGLDFLTVPAKAKVTVPRTLLTQLSLFAGQLYLSSYQDYLETCTFLGLASDVPKPNEVISADGWILRTEDGRKTVGQSPVRFLSLLMSKIRRNGQSIAKTTMGSMLEGKLLDKSDFQE